MDSESKSHCRHHARLTYTLIRLCGLVSGTLAPAFGYRKLIRKAKTEHYMGKITLNNTGVVPEEGVRGAREQLWDEYLEKYKLKNPVKYESKRATSYVDPIDGLTKAKRDEFAEIPASFKGIVRELKTLKGVIREIS